MSFKLSASKTKSSSSGTEDYTKSSTPDVPDWLAQPTQSLVGKMTKLGEVDPASLVSGVNPLQGQAAAGASQLGSDAASWIPALMNKAAPTVKAESLLTNLEDYYNPYREQVTDTAMADFDADAGRTRAQQDLSLAGSSAFGGSGAALTKSMTEGELARARSTQLAGMLSDMFTTSAGLSNTDAARRQSANESNARLDLETRAQKAALGFGRDESERANIATQAGIGEALRGIDTEQKRAPFDLQDWLTQNLAGLNPALFTGQSETGSSKTTGKSKGTSIGASAGYTYGGG